MRMKNNMTRSNKKKGTESVKEWNLMDGSESVEDDELMGSMSQYGILMSRVYDDISRHVASVSV
jgi:hypothetical protein